MLTDSTSTLSQPTVSNDSETSFACSILLVIHSENPFACGTGVRYVRYMQWGVWSAIFRPHDGGNDDTRIWM